MTLRKVIAVTRLLYGVRILIQSESMRGEVKQLG